MINVCVNMKTSLNPDIGGGLYMFLRKKEEIDGGIEKQPN